MHIPDGILPIMHCLIYFVIAGLIVTYAIIKTRKSTKKLTLIATIAAIIFLASLLNIPIILGIREHILLIPLFTIIVGPVEAVLATFIALLLQACLGLEGGITTLGANTLSMAVGAPLAAYYTHGTVKKIAGERWRDVAAFAAGAIGVIAAAFFCGLFVSLSPQWSQQQATTAMPEASFLLQEIILASILTYFMPIAAIEGIITLLILRMIPKSLAMKI